MTNHGSDNLSWIEPRLAVGGALGESSIPTLRDRLGFTHVVDVRSELQDDPELFRAHGMELLRLPTADHHAISEALLTRGVAWVRAQLDAGGSVYVHCEHGIGRSVLLAWCVMVARGESISVALSRIKAARPIASPSPAQIHALLAFARSYTSELPSWEALADLAYAHLRGPSAGSGRS
ncbi:MAG: dual specificity protein phosphatase [Myxococcaceae bacterium]|nr:dual specificity protein phosphatase [Myxococcaceae bacterium]